MFCRRRNESRSFALLRITGAPLRMTSVITLTNLSKKYGSFTAVDSIDLTVPRGTLFGFLGPNGAGKTTALRMIAGILRPTSGRVEIGGVDIKRRPRAAKSQLGFIPDRPFI